MYSGSSMRSSSTSPASSKMHSSTLVALAENRAKFTPSPSQVAPSGKGRPSRILDGSACAVGSAFVGRVMIAPAKNGMVQLTLIPCGSELAREGGVSVDFNVEWQIAFASKLAPTRDLCISSGRVSPRWRANPPHSHSVQ
ncbi:hypothetical protein EMIT0347P_10848 [Pseudomonas sp. IT-347P]